MTPSMIVNLFIGLYFSAKVFSFTHVHHNPLTGDNRAIRVNVQSNGRKTCHISQNHLYGSAINVPNTNFADPSSTIPVDNIFPIAIDGHEDSNNDKFLEEIDDYDTLLDFDRPMADESVIRDEWSLRTIGKYIPPSMQSPSSERKTNRKLWPFWDDFMEAELGDIEGELGPNDAWLNEARDYIELKVGKAIWSKKSDQQIKAELKKQQAAKGAETIEVFLFRVFVHSFAI